MREDNALRVCYANRFVGTLAMTADYKVAFQYSDEWREKSTYAHGCRAAGA